jgi:Secretion system C-terminal sorting domain
MKKKILLFTTIAAITVTVFSSYSGGPGASNGWDCTGAETDNSNPKGCTTGSCHGSAATPQINVSLELDSAGVPVSYYTPGVTYTVKIKGVNNTSNTLPKFGFQVTCVKGTVALASPINAGYFDSTALPSHVQYTTPASAPTSSTGSPYLLCNLVEHSRALSATSGSGGTGTVYMESFNWTAPVAGTGTITFWGALNAVNGDGSADGNDKWNVVQDTVKERLKSSEVGMINGQKSFVIYPNPTQNILFVKNEKAQDYQFVIYDLSGRQMSQISVVDAQDVYQVNVGDLPRGLYILNATSATGVETRTFVKQ